VCGRFTQRRSSSAFARIFSARDLADAPGERYNVAPTQAVVAVVERREGRVLDRFRWGLVPPWAKTAASGGRMINARAETVATTPAFRPSFRAKRCLVPADGFYEWQRSPEGRQPFYITRADGQPLAFAGLWSAWPDPATDLVLLTCSIVTTTSNERMAPIHNRMPVILAEEAWDLWLDPATDHAALQALLQPSDATLVAVPVASLVNSVRHQGPALIAPVLPA
jgi:putative SOS response-associated peptidase YedK